MNKKIEKQKALKALKKVINTQKDVDDAFFCDLGPVCLKFGNPGKPDKDFAKGGGIAHIIAKRDLEHTSDPDKYPETGLELVRKLIDVIIYGSVVKTVPAKQCVHLQKDGFEAVISQNWYGDKVNWLLTGWRQI